MVDKRILVLIGMMLFSSFSFAEEKVEKDLSVKFGGWSHHFKASGPHNVYEREGYNENHQGLGIEYNQQLSEGGNHRISSGYFYMKDSFTHPMHVLSAGYKYRWRWSSIYGVDFSLNSGLINRTYRSFRITGNDYEVSFRRDTQMFILPSLTVHFTKDFHADMSYIMENTVAGQSSPAIAFFRLGYVFSL